MPIILICFLASAATARLRFRLSQTGAAAAIVKKFRLVSMQSVSTTELFCAWTVVGGQVAESVLDPRQHVSDKGPREVQLLIVTVCLVENATIAHALNVTQRIVAVGTLGGCRLFGLVFRAHLTVVDAGENMNPLAAE